MDSESRVHITEALRVQLDLQRRLHEQLEPQRTSQLRIEEQGRRLQKMFDDDQLKAGGNNPPGSPDPDGSADITVVCPARKHKEVAFVIDDDEVQPAVRR